ncbi:nucleoside-diphosphate-sugar epimerase [Mesorhizobium sp. J18]|uniref:NAD-dependent epimerase/dehydratase family protein n=1 Tax=Mesorhizobium sp. J18 TaxID=935263 RepID=UPI00119A3968|nr:NAD-dependent epimerase/dehydratase family protein [Mesorhizobium sp. J18]TWG99510.1 nucleoside-diphosphate-sugar epimerase [Mesorhizobium sp. J18]
MKALITGGVGFLGAWIAKRLLAAGHEVRIFDRSTNRRLVVGIVGANAPKIEWLTGDIANDKEVLEATEGCGAIAHLAALLTPACKADPVLGAQVNLVGTINVFEAARRHGIQSIAYASSAAVFGPDDGIRPCPKTLYGVFKLACEGVARTFAEDYGVASVGFRPLVVYGPGRATGSTAGVTIACRKAVEGEPYAIPYTGETDLIYVEDVAAAFEAALLRPVSGAHVFNLHGEIVDVRRVMEIIRSLRPGAEITAKGEGVTIAARREPHDPRDTLGPLPFTSIEDGLRQTIAYYEAKASSVAHR